MEAAKKIRLLEDRLNKLATRDKDNQGIRRRIEREIRKLQKESER